MPCLPRTIRTNQLYLLTGVNKYIIAKIINDFYNEFS